MDESAGKAISVVCDPRMWVGSGKGSPRTISESWLTELALDHGVQALTPPTLRRTLPSIGFTFREGLIVDLITESAKQVLSFLWEHLGYNLVFELVSEDRVHLVGCYQRNQQNDFHPLLAKENYLHIKLPYQNQVYVHLNQLSPKAGVDYRLLMQQHRSRLPGPQHKDVDALRRSIALRLLIDDVGTRLALMPKNFHLRDKMEKYRATTLEMLRDQAQSLWGGFVVDQLSLNFLPPGTAPANENLILERSRSLDNHQPNQRLLSEEEVSLQPSTREAAEEALIARYRESFYCQRALRPAEGVFRRSRYIAFLVWSRSDRLYAILDSVDRENAIYIFLVGDRLTDDWKPDSSRTKSELLMVEPSGTTFVQRLYHREMVYERLRDWLAER